MANNAFKIFSAAICLMFVCSKSAEPGDSRFQAGSEWGWGNEASAQDATPQKKPIEIPYFDQDIGQHLLDKDFKYIANADNIRGSLRRSQTIYRAICGRLQEFGYMNPDFYENVYMYLNSDEWEQDLKTLSPGDAAFVRIITYYCFTDITDARFVQILLEKLEDKNQIKFIEEFFRVKRQHDVLRTNHWHLLMGIGANFFSHGANDKLAPGPNYDIGFGYCVFGMFCTDFRIGGIFAATPYKEDVVQSGITYPKEDIHYTAIEALLRAKLYFSYDYDLSVFGGLRLHAIEFDSKEGELIKKELGKDMKNAYSYGYTMGIAGTKFFAGNGVTPKLFGIGARFGVANFGSNYFDIGGYNWYFGFDVSARLVKY